GVDHDAHAVADGAFVDVEAGLVDVELDVGAGDADAEADHGAGHLVEVEGEVFATHADLGLDDAVGAQGGSAGSGRDGRGEAVVDDRWDAAGVADLGAGARGGGDVVDELLDEVGDLAPGVAGEDADGAAGEAFDRDGVDGLAGTDRAPDHRHAGA